MGTSRSGPQARTVRDTVSAVVLAITTITSLAVCVEPTPTLRLDRSHFWDASVHLIDKSLTGSLIGQEVYRDDDARSVAA